MNVLRLWEKLQRWNCFVSLRASRQKWHVNSCSQSLDQKPRPKWVRDGSIFLAQGGQWLGIIINLPWAFMWFTYFPCLILFYSGLYKSLFVFPELRTTEGGRGQSEEGSVEERLSERLAIDLASPMHCGITGNWYHGLFLLAAPGYGDCPTICQVQFF